MGDNQLLVLGLAGLVGLVMLFAQLKLFSINAHLGQVVDQLRRLTSEVEALRKDAQTEAPPRATGGA